MISMLAQAATAPTTTPASAPFTQAAPIEHWDLHEWEFGHGLLATGIVFIGGAITLVILFRVLRRMRLRFPAIVGIIALALYVGLLTVERTAMSDPADTLAWWLHRAFAAVFVFVGVRLLDRLVIVPILSRGGKLEVPRLLHQIVNSIVAIFALLIFGSYAFGWDIVKFLAGSAVVSIVLGLALQETLSNFFSGMVMQGSPPFKLGDFIICGNYEGRVVDMTWRAVTLLTLEDNYVTIPNATVSKAEIINFHAPTTATARIVKVGLEYDLPPLDAQRLLKAAALETAGVVPTPEPDIRLTDFADSAVVYIVKFWIVEPAKHLTIEQLVRVNIWYRLKEAGYEVPFPMQVQVSEKVRDHKAAANLRTRSLDRVPLLAPGSFAWTEMVGKSTCGSGATGRRG